MRLLITGGAGTLGRSIIDHWGPRTSACHIIDNFATSSANDLPMRDNVVIHAGSIASFPDLKAAFEAARPSHVIHCAASYKDPENWIEDIDTNIVGAAHLARLSEQFDVQRLISIQTVLCYGRPDSIPIPVSAPLRPESSYAISKVAGEQYLALGTTPFVSLRVGNVISPGLAIGPIPTFYTKLKNREPVRVTKSVRDFLDISDFLDALDLSIAADAPEGIFNISSGQGTSMVRILDLVADHLGVQTESSMVEPQPDDIPEIVLDPSHTHEVLGWHVTVPIEESLRRCLTFYDTYGVGPIYSHLRATEEKRA